MKTARSPKILNKPDHLCFGTSHLNTGLKLRSIRGGMITVTSQVIKFILQTGSTVILARLLTPGDFGIVAMVSAITNFILVFKDLGLSAATVQRDEITHEQVSTLFWINIGLSALLMAITMLIAPLIAWFYHDPRLTLVTIVIASGFIFFGAAVQHQALLSRQMRFTALALVEVTSLAAGICTAVAIARYTHMGYWALVLMQLANAFTYMIGVWIACRWLPGRSSRGTGIYPMLAFGGKLTFFNLFNYFARNLDNVLLGRFWGAVETGLYSRAYSFLLLPMGQITAPLTSVAVPALSRLQNEPQRYCEYYLKAVQIIVYLSMPLAIAMGVLSTEIIQVVLGPQWKSAAPIFRNLVLISVLQPIDSTVGWIFISLGRTDRMLKWGFFACPVFAISFLAGIHWGAIGVATSYTIANLLLFIPQMIYSFRDTAITLRNFFLTLSGPFLMSLMMGMVMSIVHRVVLAAPVFVRITMPLLMGILAGLLCILFVKKVREDMRHVFSNISSIFGKNLKKYV